MPDDCPRALINRERVGEADGVLRGLGLSQGFHFGPRNYRQGPYARHAHLLLIREDESLSQLSPVAQEDDTFWPSCRLTCRGKRRSATLVRCLA